MKTTDEIAEEVNTRLHEVLEANKQRMLRLYEERVLYQRQRIKEIREQLLLDSEDDNESTRGN